MVKLKHPKSVVNGVIFTMQNRSVQTAAHLSSPVVQDVLFRFWQLLKRGKEKGSDKKSASENERGRHEERDAVGVGWG